MAESITKRTQRAVIRSVDPFGYEQGSHTYIRFLGNMASGTDEFSDEQIAEMVERVYSSALEKGDVKPWKEGDFKKGRRPPERVAERIDMLNLTIGDPQVYNSMKESTFTPTRGVEEGDKFWTFRDKNQMGQIFHGVKNKEGKIIRKGLKEKIPYMEKETARRKASGKKPRMFNVGYKGDVKKGKADFSFSGSHVGMERFQVGVGEDDIGKYMAIYDNWDIDYGEAGSKIREIAKSVLPGFQIYDRMYYEAAKPKSDLKLRGTEPKLAEPEYVSPKKQQIEDKIVDWMKRVF